MRRGRDLGDAVQQLDVGRALVEIVVADEAAIRLAAELAILGSVDLFEQRALIPVGALVAFERLADLQQKGILSQEEYASKKAELLGRL